jgi:tetratricopeptide (TPR) repeat protein
LERDPASLELLQLLANVGVTPLPVAILAEHRSALPSALADAFAGDRPMETLEALQWLAPLQWSSTGVSLPEAARIGVRAMLDSKDLGQSIEWVVAFLDDALPEDSDDPQHWPRVDVLVDHVLAAVAEARELYSDGAGAMATAACLASLLERVGRYFNGRGRYEAASNVLQNALAICDEHPSISPGFQGKVRRSLAAPAHGLGQSAFAVGLLEEAMQIHDAAGEALESARDRIELAAVLGDCERTTTALKHLESALELLPDDGSAVLEAGRAHLVGGSLLVGGGKQREGRGELERSLKCLERVGDRRAGLYTIAARGALGYALAYTDEPAQGRAMLEDALRRSEEILGPEHPEVGVLLSNLANVCTKTENVDLAQKHLERSLEIAERLLPPEHPARYIRHSKLANTLAQQHDYQAALEHWTVAVGLAERLFADSPSLVDALHGLARTQQRLGNPSAAKLAYARALYVAEALDPSDPRRLTDLRSQLAETEISLGNAGGALAALTDIQAQGEEEAAIFRLTAGHLIERLGKDLAQACRASGQLKAAEGIVRQVHSASRALVRDTLDRKDPGAVLLAASLATQAESLADAARGFERAGLLAGSYRRSLSLDLARGWQTLARAHLERDEPDEAISTLEHALTTVPEDASVHGALLTVAAGVHSAAARQKSAIDLAGEAVEWLEEAQDTNGLIRALEQLAKLQWAANRPVEALDTFRRRLDTARAGNPDDLLQLTLALTDLGHALRRQRKLNEALEVDRQAVEAARRDEDDRQLATALLGLARTYEARGDLPSALAAYEERLRLVRASASPDHLAEGVTLHDLGDVRLALGEIDEAIGLYKRAVAHKRQTGRALDLAATMLALAQAHQRRGEDDDALQILRERLVMLESLPTRNRVAEADTLVYMAAIEQERSHYEEALEVLHGALELVRDLNDDLRLAHTCIQASVAALAAGQDELAARLAGQAVEAFEGASRPDADGLAFALSVKARALRREPAAMLEALLSAACAYQSTRHLSVAAAAPVARVLADTCVGLGLVELAASVEEAARVVLEGDASQSRDATRKSPLERIRVELACGRLSEARQALGEAASGKTQIELSIEWLQLGRLLQARGAHDEAAEAFEQALASIDGPPEREAVQEALIRSSLADSLRALGREQEAVGLYDAACDALERRNAREAVGVLLSLGRALYASDRLAEASAALRRRLKLLKAARPDPSAEGVTWHDLGNVQRLRGQTKRAIKCYRQALEDKRKGGSSPRDLTVTVLSLAYMLRRVKPAPAGEMAELARASEVLLADAVQVAEMQVPKALVIALEPVTQRERGAAARAEAAAALSALDATAVAGLMRASRADGRVPPPAGAEAELSRQATREPTLAALVAGKPPHPRLSAQGERVARLLWSSDAPSQPTEHSEDLLLGAQLCLLDGDAKAALSTLKAVKEQEQSIDASLARALRLCLTGVASSSAVARVESELTDLLAAGVDDISALGIATGAIDCNEPRLAQRALMSVDTQASTNEANGPELAADAGVAWHIVAVAFEAVGDIESARDAYDRARAAFATLSVDLEIAPMRHQADMLRFAGQIEAALALEHTTPFSPAPAGTRVLTAATCLRAARLQTLVGRPLAGRALNWQALSCARFVPPRGGTKPGEPAPAATSATTPKPRKTDHALVQGLTPLAIALLELLRQDAHDSALCRILPGLLVHRGSWRTAVVAARELERAGLAEVWLRSGWLRLSKRGARVAAVLSS